MDLTLLRKLVQISSFQIRSSAEPDLDICCSGILHGSEGLSVNKNYLGVKKEL